MRPPKEGGRRGPSDARAAGSGPGGRQDPPAAGGVDTAASRAHLLEVAARLGIRGRTRLTKPELVAAIQRANDRATRAARDRGR